jgi:hypothetical protein
LDEFSPRGGFSITKELEMQYIFTMGERSSVNQKQTEPTEELSAPESQKPQTLRLNSTRSSPLFLGAARWSVVSS